MFLENQLSGIVNSLRYHTQDIKSLYSTPDNLLSGQNGTMISLLNFSASYSSRSLPLLPWSNSNSQIPFKFIHRSRTNCGRGYSGLGMDEIQEFNIMIPP